MSAICVKIDKKIYPNQTCSIRGLEFSVRQGEFVAIIGPSGAGKTTLLNIIAGIDSQFNGEVTFNKARQKQGIAGQPNISFMFQDARLLPWLTVEQNIELVFGGDNQNKHTRMLSLLQKVGLKEEIDKYPGQLSGGMKRRVSMVRAFVNHPQLLLLDEPFQSLDEPTANELRAMLLEMWVETRTTILFVTHNLREALSIADRVLFLSAMPASLILDFPIEAARSGRLEDGVVADLHARLLKRYPKLLSGSLNSRHSPVDAVD